MQKLITLVVIPLVPVSAIASDAPSKDDVAALIKQLKDISPAVRNKAARALENLDPAAKDAVPVLIEALKLKDEVSVATVLPVAARALGRLGSAAVPALTEALEVKDGRLQAYAAMALKQIGPDAKPAVPALVEVIKKYKEPAQSAKLQAIAALGKIGAGAKEAVPVLIDVTKEKPPTSAARLAAVTALGQIGPEAKTAVPTLIELLGEEEIKAGPIRLEAARALGLIGSAAGEEAISALVALLENKKLGPSRIVAINALGQIGPPAKNALAALKKAGEDAELKTAATKAIEKIESKK
jgi:HEAT repeat protein